MIKEDLEALTGQLIQGDETNIVIQLLKDTPYKEDLLTYLNLCSDKDLITRVKEGYEVVKNKKLNKTTVEEDNSGPSLEKWLSGKEFTISV